MVFVLLYCRYFIFDLLKEKECRSVSKFYLKIEKSKPIISSVSGRLEEGRSAAEGSVNDGAASSHVVVNELLRSYRVRK